MQKMWQCPECEQLFDQEDLVTVYECGSCGETFTQDDSADGISNRCPNDNKFAGLLTHEGCPDDYVECEAVQAEQNADGEWEVVEEPQPAAKPVHYHVKIIDPSNGQEDISFSHTYQTEESIRAFLEWYPGELELKADGTYYQVNSGRTVAVFPCTEKHKKTKVMPLHPKDLRIN